jgi:hypothetical protein
MKIKIVEKGYQGFTGHLGQIEFVDAVSVNDFNVREALNLGGYLRIVEVDEAGNELGPVSHAAELASSRNISAKVVEPLKRGVGDKAPDVVEQNAGKTVVVAPDPLPKPEVDAELAGKVWTRAELEAVADKDGIKGLRDVATPMGVKGVAIPKLIDDILAAQTQGQKA